MISSMTGFGRGEVARDGYKAVFEVSSVNSRFLEVSLRLPRWLFALESNLKSLVDKQLSRGKVFCHLTLERDRGIEDISLNTELADWYIKTLKELATKHGLEGSVSVSDLVRVSDIWMGEEKRPDEAIEGILREALTAALAGLVEARRREGQALSEDLRKRLDIMLEVLEEIKAEAGAIPEAIRQKLTTRIEELFGTSDYDPQRLAQEIAYLAERADITEECVRLEVHCRHFSEALAEGVAVGRKLNFLLQEMNREVNTIGSKSASADNTTRVVSLKEELERIREQVQNIE